LAPDHLSHPTALFGLDQSRIRTTSTASTSQIKKDNVPTRLTPPHHIHRRLCYFSEEVVGTAWPWGWPQGKGKKKKLCVPTRNIAEFADAKCQHVGTISIFRQPIFPTVPPKSLIFQTAERLLNFISQSLWLGEIIWKYSQVQYEREREREKYLPHSLKPPTRFSPTIRTRSIQRHHWRERHEWIRASCSRLRRGVPSPIPTDLAHPV
jgi:hypothetical protein